MRYSGLVENILRFSPRLRRVLLPAFTLILLVSSFAVATSSEAAGADDLKKLLKEATKLQRAGSYVEAEAVLRRAIDLAPTRSEAKVELAYT